jgi:hypothetical protein
MVRMTLGELATHITRLSQPVQVKVRDTTYQTEQRTGWRELGLLDGMPIYYLRRGSERRPVKIMVSDILTLETGEEIEVYG